MARTGGFWKLHGDGSVPGPGAVVAPDERLSWPRTVGIGVQHVMAMFGATVLVPTITGFSPSTTLFFSAVGTALFLLLTRGRLPSYLGSSFAFLAPIAAAKTAGGPAAALGGIVVTGVLLALVGLLVQRAGSAWVDRLLPPAVTGTIVALIGLNLAPAAWTSVQAGPVTAVVTIAAIVLSSVLFRGLLGRLSILLGVLVGYVVALVRDEVDFSAVGGASWVGLPQFTAPSFDLAVIAVFIPVVLVLVAENVGHVRSVAALTGRDLDPLTGRALVADGLATTLAGLGGGSGTTTYAENIGVMAASRVYSTAAYAVAAGAALLLSLSPKFGAVIASVPAGVLGGAGTVLYGLVSTAGREKSTRACVALVIGIADYTLTVGGLTFTGIALGTVAAVGIYHLMAALGRWRGTDPGDATGADRGREAAVEPASPASAPRPDLTR